MAKLDNPAGRLHALLKEYQRAASPERTIRQTWAEVLGTDETAVAVALTEVGTLIPAIQAAVSRSGDEEQLELVDTYVLHWSIPITTPDWPTGQNPSPGKGLVDVGALAVLGALSSFLSSTRSEGAVPDDENLHRLTVLVREALDELAAARDLPAEVRQLILDRLDDIARALNQLRIVGPDAARAAAERLVFAMATVPEETRNQPPMKKAVAAAGTVWGAFLSGPYIQPAVKSWVEIVGALGRALGG